MKKKVISITLALALLLSCLTGFSALAISTGTEYTGLGTVYHKEDYKLSDGLSLSTVSAVSSKYGNQKAQVLTFNPNSDTAMKIHFGTYVYGASTVSSMIKDEEAEGNQVLFGMNGDFFSTKTGIPLGIMINNGIIYCSDAGQNALGINADGSVVVGKPVVSTTLSAGTISFPIDHINKYPSPYGIYLLTPEFSKTTKSTAPSLEIVLRVNYGTLTHNGIVTATVEKINANAQGTSIEPGTFVLSAQGEYAVKMAELTEGSIVTLNTVVSGGFENVVTAVGGGDFFIRDGQAADFSSDSHISVANPRSALGVLPTGEMLIVEVDGRQSGYSKGMTLRELCDMMLQLGCVYAMNLDGGGSSVASMTLPGNATAAAISKPSNGKEAIVSNAVLFVNKNAATGQLANYHVYPNSPFALKNAGIDFTVKGTDTTHHAVGLSSYPTLSADGGSFTGYHYQAPATAGAYTVTAEQGGVTGSTTVNVVDSITSLQPNVSNVSMSPGGSVNLQFSANVNNILAFSSPESFEWKINGEGGGREGNYLVKNKYGSVDKNGKFTAASNLSSDKLVVTASYGNVAANITISLADAKPPVLLENFEGTLPTATGTEGALVAIQRTDSPVKYGKSAAYVTYDFTSSPETGHIDLSGGWSIPSGASALDLWSTFPGGIAVVQDKNGNTQEIQYQVVKTDENGYNLLRASLPSNMQKPLTVVSPLRVYSNADNGSFYVDELRAYFGDFSYLDVPTDMWATDYINEVTYRGIMNGSDDDGIILFNPNNNLTRGEFAVVITKYLNLNLESYKNFKLNYADAEGIPDCMIP